MNESESERQKREKIEHLLIGVETLTRDVESSAQLEIDPGFKEIQDTLERDRVELGKYLIEKARKLKGEELMKILQSLNQVYSWTDLKSEEIGTTNEERKKLWEKSQEEIKENKRKSRKGLLGWIKEKI